MERSLIKNLEENKLSKISGVVSKIRDTKYMVFIMLKDRSSFIQVSIDKNEQSKLADKALEITTGSIVAFEGEMKYSEYVKNGGKEFIPSSIEIISLAETIPLEENANSDTKLDYRWLDLRNDKNEYTFRIQSAFIEYMREYLYKEEFTEIHTPKLLGTASESGSDVFEVKYFDRKAYLAQSPQFYKQMAIASGLERVFEVAPAFRAENSNTNRHCTEFTSFDVELAYINSFYDVMHLEQEMLKYALGKLKENYGDIIKERYDMEIIVPTGDFPVIKLEDLLSELNRRYGYVIPEGDIGDMNAETEKLAYKYAMEEYNSEFLFVTDFKKEKRAFYHMRENDIPQGYDLIWRGMEITTGAQREHRYEKLCNQAKEKGLGKDVEFYLQFFRYGCAPHGGFAIGVDRLTLLLLGFDHIRDAQFIFRNPSRLNP
ncbi:MAG: aspartate--tRNA(Asn) ligase [Firmicutes bacterium]|nr:aspartate--tRNA(Asn) ligase [Bacillota bacterium]